MDFKEKNNSLSRNKIEQYIKNGFYFPIKLLSKKEANTFTNQIILFHESEEAKSYKDLSNEIYRFKTYLIFEWADQLVHHHKVLDLAEDLIGKNIMVWSVGMFIKPPKSKNFVSWHQDATYYSLTKLNKIVNVWVSLTDSTLENGAMSYLPGSHNLGQVSHTDTWDKNNIISRGETADIEINEQDSVNVEINAGESSIHHLYTLHKSRPNQTEEYRIAVVIRYISPEVAPLSGNDCAMLVRGKDNFNNFELEPRPIKDLHPSAMRAHAHSMVVRDLNTGHNILRRENYSLKT